jgi:hypothetical protein
MGNVERRFVEVLKSDIAEWELVAVYFENLPADSRVCGLGDAIGKEKASQIRARIEGHLKLIEEIEESN